MPVKLVDTATHPQVSLHVLWVSTYSLYNPRVGSFFIVLEWRRIFGSVHQSISTSILYAKYSILLFSGPKYVHFLFLLILTTRLSNLFFSSTPILLITCVGTYGITAAGQSLAQACVTCDPGYTCPTNSTIASTRVLCSTGGYCPEGSSKFQLYFLI